MIKQLRSPGPVEPFNVETHRSMLSQQWRRDVATLNDLEENLHSPSLDPLLRAHYTVHYEFVQERARTFFVELCRLTVPAPGPPLHADPNLLAIQAGLKASHESATAAWDSFNATQASYAGTLRAAYVSYQETLRASTDAYREAIAVWERQMQK